MAFSFKNFLSTISKKSEDNLRPSASTAVPQSSPQPFWERNVPRTTVENAGTDFEVIPPSKANYGNILEPNKCSTVDNSEMSDTNAVSKENQLDNVKCFFADKDILDDKINTEFTVLPDSSVTNDSTVNPTAFSLNSQTKSTPPLNFDIESLINKVKQSMLNSGSGDKKPDNAVISEVLVNDTVASEVIINDEIIPEVSAQDSLVPAASDKKIWRQGMSDGDQNSTKTVFIRKSLNPTYENCAKEKTSYESASGKLLREIDYFAKILTKVQADMAENEHRANDDVVLGVRELLKQRLSELIVKVNSFSSDALEGDIKKAPVVQNASKKNSDTLVEYVFPSERKTTNSESEGNGINGSRLNKCVDCNGHFVVNSTETIESVMLAHIQSPFHRSVVGNTILDINTVVEKVNVVEKAPNAVEKTKKVKKDMVSAKLLMINRMTPCLIDDSLLNCAVCGVACDAKDPKSHIDLKEHGDRLVVYNLREHRELMRNNPEAFASFQLNDLHYVVNKIFVDPIAKFAYCGVCKKEVPAHQKNIEGHVDSPNHNKLLVTALEAALNRERDEEDFLGDFIAKSSVKQQQQQPPPPSNRMDSVGVPEESSLLRYVRKNHGFRHMSGTYACLICNVKRMSTVKKINSHFSGKQHSEISNKMAACTAVSHAQKAELLENFVSATYDVHPIMYECLICADFDPTTSLDGALQHIASDRHVQLKEQYLRQPAAVQQSPHLNYAKIVPLKQDPTKMYCVPCRVPLNSIVAAFEHVRAVPHNPDTLIEYIHNAGNVYNCMACSISFRGDAALISHAALPEHNTAKIAKEILKMSQGSNSATAPVTNYSPKGFVVVEQDGTVLKNNAKKNNVKSKAMDNGVKNKDKNNKESKAVNAKTNKNINHKVMADEMALLNNNGVVYLGNESYFCRPCGNGKMCREEVFGHVFSVQHAENVIKK